MQWFGLLNYNSLKNKTIILENLSTLISLICKEYELKLESITNINQTTIHWKQSLLNHFVNIKIIIKTDFKTDFIDDIKTDFIDEDAGCLVATMSFILALLGQLIWINQRVYVESLKKSWLSLINCKIYLMNYLFFLNKINCLNWIQNF